MPSSCPPPPPMKVWTPHLPPKKIKNNNNSNNSNNSNNNNNNNNKNNNNNNSVTPLGKGCWSCVCCLFFACFSLFCFVICLLVFVCVCVWGGGVTVCFFVVGFCFVGFFVQMVYGQLLT